MRCELRNPPGDIQRTLVRFSVGLWYPIVIAGATVIIDIFFLPETSKRNIDA